MRKLLLIPLLLAAACGDGGTGPGNDAALTAAEAAELNRAVFGIMQEMVRTSPFGALRAGSPPSANVLAAGNSITVPIQETHACRPSGSTAVTGTATVEWGDPAGSSALQAQVARLQIEYEGRALEGYTCPPDVFAEVAAREPEARLVLAIGGERLEAAEEQILAACHRLSGPPRRSEFARGSGARGVRVGSRIVGRGIGHVPEGRRIFNRLSVRENLDFVARMYEVRERASVVDRADWVRANTTAFASFPSRSHTATGPSSDTGSAPLRTSRTRTASRRRR